MIVKSLLCFLTIAPPVLGQVSALSPVHADRSCTELQGNLHPYFELSSGPPHFDEMADSTGSSVSTTTNDSSHSDYGHQTKRILYIMPNFKSISAGSQLPTLSPADKFLTATQDSFDYSSFVFVGILAGVGQAQDSDPEFGQGAVGYGRYYWHTLVDQTSENYFVEAFMPIVLRQDPRYYTLGRGGVLKRTLYALSRAAIMRTDAGNPVPNYSEIIGAGAAAGISNLYYPDRERTWTKNRTTLGHECRLGRFGSNIQGILAGYQSKDL
jgi:hypothetical protein